MCLPRTRDCVSEASTFEDPDHPRTTMRAEATTAVLKEVVNCPPEVGGQQPPEVADPVVALDRQDFVSEAKAERGRPLTPKDPRTPTGAESPERQDGADVPVPEGGTPGSAPA